MELRAATGLARLRRERGRRAEARDLLAPVMAGSLEGFDTPDLKEAKALLTSWRNEGGRPAFVQVFGRRDDEAIPGHRRPASEKRQGTKSREVGALTGSLRRSGVTVSRNCSMSSPIQTTSECRR